MAGDSTFGAVRDPIGADLQRKIQAQRAMGKAQRIRRQREYIASLLEGLKQVAHSAQMPFLAYLITVALEESNNEKTGG